MAVAAEIAGKQFSLVSLNPLNALNKVWSVKRVLVILDITLHPELASKP